MHQPRALGRFDVLECRDVYAATLREGERRLCGCTLRIEGRLQRRPPAFDGAIGLSFGEAPHADRQSARRGEFLDRLAGQAGLRQSLADAIGECGRERQQRLRRQLFGADLDQEIPGAHDTTLEKPGTFSDFSAGKSENVPGFSDPFSIGKPSASRLAKYASATPRASVRTRRM